EVSERGIVPELNLDLPESVLYRGREPGRWVTFRSATLLLAGVPMVIGLGLAVGLRMMGVQAAWLVAVAVIFGLAAYVLILLVWRLSRKSLDRAIDFAWTSLAPQLHAKDFRPDDAAFLASLAMTSVNQGRPDLRTHD